ncbi:hypothetical protein LMB98_07620 [Limosilactobacillus reuteri]|uniref:hypothetical protein n=1 Tax=Limosilactobacillus reuteri TaxID=1598 RepID=UPI001E329FF4|nr:hypothetical protein [Limosilactobacillus reuteri]MCC4397885.1 hypothetical protein [Limosilactobacillus reuteri]MCC4410131.1 hypothetical protein [Limosilactobacillus reuteri]
MNEVNFSNDSKKNINTKKVEINLATILNSPDKFTCRISGNTDVLAKMLVAGLTYHPELFKKTFKGMLERVYGG